MQDSRHVVVCTCVKRRPRAFIWPATCKYHCGAIKVLSWKHSRQSAVEGPLSKKRRSSEARQAGFTASIYIYTTILKISIKNLKGLRNARKSIETSGVISVL